VQFDKVQKFTDKPLTRCPECRKGRVHRVVQPAAIVFKGSGWYATDSRASASKRSGRAEKSESAEKTDTPAKSEKSDAKPAKSETGGSASDA
jgi:putative FmdB family regulatory protein